MEVPYGYREIRVTDNYETRWIYVGPSGAIDFHCTNMDALKRMRAASEMDAMYLWRSGGVETHYRQPPDYMRSETPHHDRCWILGGACWHDGSSLAASEKWIPLLESCGEEAIWDELRVRYRLQFGNDAHLRVSTVGRRGRSPSAQQQRLTTRAKVWALCFLPSRKTDEAE